ncbi:hypothetical protein Trydic_g18768 [Trypoxylus dichotomus]
MLSTSGIPSVLVSDNGTQFMSAEFQNFLQQNGIVHKLGAPYHPVTNGLAERYIQAFKQAIRAIKCLSPSQLMFNRNIRSRLDFMKPTTQEEITEELITKFGEVERVAARNYGQEEKRPFWKN